MHRSWGIAPKFNRKRAAQRQLSGESLLGAAFGTCLAVKWSEGLLMELGTRRIQSVFSSAGTAVCYQCSTRSSDCASNCPQCNFPLITQSELSPLGGIRIGDVLRRESLRIGAPPLPGVHSTPRKAQLLAEARKRARNKAQESEKDFSQADTLEDPATPRSSAWSLASVCCLAVGIGMVAAVVQRIL